MFLENLFIHKLNDQIRAVRKVILGQPDLFLVSPLQRKQDTACFVQQ